jgi:hypothetical protein
MPMCEPEFEKYFATTSMARLRPHAEEHGEAVRLEAWAARILRDGRCAASSG